MPIGKTEPSEFPWARSRLIKYAAWRKWSLLLALLLSCAVVALTASEAAFTASAGPDNRVTATVDTAVYGPAQVRTLYPAVVARRQAVVVRTSRQSSSSSSSSSTTTSQATQILPGALLEPLPNQCLAVGPSCVDKAVMSYSCAEVFDASPLTFHPALCGKELDVNCTYALSQCAGPLQAARRLNAGRGAAQRAAEVRLYGNVSVTRRSPSALDERFFGVPGYGYAEYLRGFDVDAAAGDTAFFVGPDDIKLLRARPAPRETVARTRTIFQAVAGPYPRVDRMYADMVVTGCYLGIQVLSLLVLLVAASSGSVTRHGWLMTAFLAASGLPVLLFHAPYAYSVTPGPGNVADANLEALNATATQELFVRAAAQSALRTEFAIDAFVKVGPGMVSLLPALYKATLTIKSLFPESVVLGVIHELVPWLQVILTVSLLLPVYQLLADPLLLAALFCYTACWLVMLWPQEDMTMPFRTGTAFLKRLAVKRFLHHLLWFLAFGLFVAWLVIAHNWDYFDIRRYTSLPGPIATARVFCDIALKYILATVAITDALVRMVLFTRSGQRASKAQTKAYYRALDEILDEDDAIAFQIDDHTTKVTRFFKTAKIVVDPAPQPAKSEIIKIPALLPVEGAGAVSPPLAPAAAAGATVATGTLNSGVTPGDPSNDLSADQKWLEKELHAKARFEAELRVRRLKAEAERKVREDRERQLAERKQQQQARSGLVSEGHTLGDDEDVEGPSPVINELKETEVDRFDRASRLTAGPPQQQQQQQQQQQVAGAGGAGNLASPSKAPSRGRTSGQESPSASRDRSSSSGSSSRPRRGRRAGKRRTGPTLRSQQTVVELGDGAQQHTYSSMRKIKAVGPEDNIDPSVVEAARSAGKPKGNLKPGPPPASYLFPRKR